MWVLIASCLPAACCSTCLTSKIRLSVLASLVCSSLDNHDDGTSDDDVAACQLLIYFSYFISFSSRACCGARSTVEWENRYRLSQSDSKASTQPNKIVDGVRKKMWKSGWARERKRQRKNAKMNTKFKCMMELVFLLLNFYSIFFLSLGLAHINTRVFNVNSVVCRFLSSSSPVFVEWRWCIIIKTIEKRVCN